MIEQMRDVPSNVAAFRAVGDVTKEDFDNVVIPAVDHLVIQTGELNFLLHLDTSMSDFTIGAWLKDAGMGLKNLLKWRKAAIVSDSDAIKKFTDAFSVVIPGEFKGFSKDQLREAIKWAST